MSGGESAGNRVLLALLKVRYLNAFKP